MEDLKDANVLYWEKISSRRTTVLFMVLTVALGVLAFWRLKTARLDILAGVLIFFAGLFLFYSINYRALIIQLTPLYLKLTFGIFNWTIPLDNMETYTLDDVPVFMRNGGAGIHFMSVHGRYRASFNFLEYPRIVIALKRKKGLVRDISFSTCQPEEILRCIQEAIRNGGTIPRGDNPGSG